MHGRKTPRLVLSKEHMNFFLISADKPNGVVKEALNPEKYDTRRAGHLIPSAQLDSRAMILPIEAMLKDYI